MITNNSSLSQNILYLIAIIFLTILSTTLSQNCLRFCGQIPLKYPFGSGPGCGDPRFQPYLTCSVESDQPLKFHTRRGSYPVTSIDYSTQTLYLSDPSMSTCSCSQPSRGFGLDWDAPFSFHRETLFALLACSPEDSPVLQNSTARARLCDQKAVPVCGFLSSCQAIAASGIDSSPDSCCVYAPVDLGPAFDMDLGNLKCGSYSGLYGFRGRQSDPETWKYGVALEYKFGVYDEFPSYCSDCEKGFGVCGYTGSYNSFICNCPSGLNTTTDCFFGYSSHASISTSGLLKMCMSLVLFLFFMGSR